MMRGPTCSRHAPGIRCRLRSAAMRRGEFIYWFFTQAWTFAVDRQPLGGHPVYGWTFCPWCGGDLPDATSALDNWLASGGRTTD